MRSSMLSKVICRVNASAVGRGGLAGEEGNATCDEDRFFFFLDIKKRFWQNRSARDSRPLVGGCWPQSPAKISPKSRFIFNVLQPVRKNQVFHISSKAMKRPGILLMVIFFLTIACKQDSSQPIWQLKLQSRPYADPIIRDEKFFVFSQAGEVVCGNVQTGEKNWTQKIEDPVLGTPVLSDDSLFLATQNGFVYALNPENGSQKWRIELKDQFIAPLTIFSGGVLVPSETGTLYALSQANGSEIWRFSGQRKFNARPVVAGNNILIGGWNKQFTSLKPDGSVNWKLTTAEIITGDPLILNNSVFFPCYDQFVYSVEIPTGRLRWRFAASHPSNLAVINQEIVFASGTNLLHVSRDSGKLLRTTKFGKTISRIYVQNSNLYVLSHDVYRIRPSNATVSVLIRAPNPIFKLSFAVGMILASDDLYSIYGYGRSTE